MISIFWAVVIAVVSACLGMFLMALLAAGAQADECMKCEMAKWHKEEGV